MQYWYTISKLQFQCVFMILIKYNNLALPNSLYKMLNILFSNEYLITF